MVWVECINVAVSFLMVPFLWGESMSMHKGTSVTAAGPQLRCKDATDDGSYEPIGRVLGPHYILWFAHR